ncbi:hypothetical protein QFC20_005260 [Naganishia adeliensis]|uniref:Uncharacterized protein n=1 Tax=Naganishia adeliensis TaxID=92952 RepID=A0ACC2VPK0_9TREE|nr:hypothetical protein QFC20_005260 [Naganishia adeliensis]
MQVSQLINTTQPPGPQRQSEPPQPCHRIPQEHLGAAYNDLPHDIRSLYTASVKIPTGVPRPLPPVDASVDSLRTALVPQVTDKKCNYDFSDQDADQHPSAGRIPPLDLVNSLTIARSSAWARGKVSIRFRDSADQSTARYPLWVLELWEELHELLLAQVTWEKAIGFVDRSVRSTSVPDIPALLQQIRQQICNCGWKSSLFRRRVTFEFHTLSIAPLLDETRWATKSQIDCGLITLRLEYRNKQDKIWIASSDLSDMLRLGNPLVAAGDGPTYHPSIYRTAAWLSEDVDRVIVSIVQHEDTKTFPQWWIRPGGLAGDWKGLANLVQPKASFRPRFVSRGFQKDQSSCGPAALSAIRWFLDDSTPLWSWEERLMARVKLFREILQAREVHKVVIEDTTGSLLSLPSTNYELPVKLSKPSLWNSLIARNAAGAASSPVPRVQSSGSSSGSDDGQKITPERASKPVPKKTSPTPPRGAKLSIKQREEIFQAAVDRNEIASFSEHVFKCVCPKKLMGLTRSIIKMTASYDVQLLRKHFKTDGHCRIFELDDDGAALVDADTGKVVKKGMNFKGKVYKMVPSIRSKTNTGPMDGPCVGLIGERYRPLLAARLEWDHSIPLPTGDVNRKGIMCSWTSTELSRYNAGAREAATWKLNWGTKSIQSVKCSGRGPLRHGNFLCDACHSLKSMERFQKALRRRGKDQQELSDMNAIERDEETIRRLESTRKSYLQMSAIVVHENRQRPGIIAMSNVLDDTSSPDAKVFERLAALARDGAFAGEETAMALMKQLAEFTARSQKGPDAMKGMRYDEMSKNFWTLVRGSGGFSTNQYATVKQILGGPSTRTIQRSIAERARGFAVVGALELARLDQYLKELGDLGLKDVPLVVMADATKLPKDSKRPAVSFTTVMAHDDVIGHLVGSTLSMDETAVRLDEDVDTIWKAIETEGGAASQVLAVMVGVPLDGVAPKVVALYPTDGKENGAAVKTILDELRKAIQDRGHRVLSYALDGGSAEKGAQRITRKETSQENLELAVPGFNVLLKAQIVDGTPLIMVQDVEHARKTLRNNFTSGARLMNLGKAVVCYEYLLRLLGYEGSGIVKSDLLFQDKQDDGAAVRLFNSQALESLMEEGKIREGMEGLFTVLSIFDQALETIEWLSTSLLLLIESHVTYFPNIPLQPWNHSTKGLEHWFGHARKLRQPDFTMSELLDGCRSQDIRTQIYHTGDPKLIPRAIASRKVGYQFDNERLDPNGETWDRLREWPSKTARTSIIPALAHAEACSYLHLLGMPEPRKEYSAEQLNEQHAQLFKDAYASSETGTGSSDDENETIGLDDDSSSSASDSTSESPTEGKLARDAKMQRNLRISAEAVVRAGEVRNTVLEDEETGIQDLRKARLVPTFDFSSTRTKRSTDSGRHTMSLSHLIEAPSSVGSYGTNILDPMKALEARRKTDAKPRVHTHKSKKNSATESSAGGQADVRKVRSRVRALREFGDEDKERTSRTRTKHSREIRWQSSIKCMKSALANPMDIYRGRSTLRRPLDYRGIADSSPLTPSAEPGCKRRVGGHTSPSRISDTGQSLGTDESKEQRPYLVPSQEFESTEELSSLDLMVFLPADSAGKLFTHGDDRLYFTHAPETELVHHFGPASENMQKIQAGEDEWFRVDKKVTSVWNTIATDAMGDAIEAGIRAYRTKEKSAKGVVNGNSVAKKATKRARAEGPEMESRNVRRTGE